MSQHCRYTKPVHIEIRQHRKLLAALYPKLPVIVRINPDYRLTISDYLPLIEQTVELLRSSGEMSPGYYEVSLHDALAELDDEILIA